MMDRQKGLMLAIILLAVAVLFHGYMGRYRLVALSPGVIIQTDNLTGETKINRRNIQWYFIKEGTEPPPEAKKTADVKTFTIEEMKERYIDSRIEQEKKRLGMKPEDKVSMDIAYQIITEANEHIK